MARINAFKFYHSVKKDLAAVFSVKSIHFRFTGEKTNSITQFIC